MERLAKHLTALAVAGAMAAGTAGGALAHGRPGTDHPRAGAVHRALHHRGGVLRAVTNYLEITPRALLEQLRSGKSLAEIAASMPGKSADGLKQAMLARIKVRLDKAVTAGRLSAAQEQAILTTAASRLDVLLNKKFHKK